MELAVPLGHERPTWSDKRVGRMLGALVSTVLALTASMLIFVLVQGWPSFAVPGPGRSHGNGPPVNWMASS